MKKKIITLIIVALVLITPTIIAVISYISAQNNPITMDSVSKLVLSVPERDKQTFKKGEQGSKEIYSLFINMNNEADKVDSLTSEQSEYAVYKVSYYCYNKKIDYTYYFSSDPNNNFYRNQYGDIYHISPKTAKSFLKTDYALDLFPEAIQPTLSVGNNENVLPLAANWNYVGIDGTFMEGRTETSAKVSECNVTGGLQFSFSDKPDYVYAVIKNLSGDVVFDDVYDDIDLSLFSENTVYNVTLTAKWYQSEQRKNYGEATYQFTANVLSPAVFYLKTYDNLTYGDFVVVSAKNVIDPSLISFSSKPSIDFTPLFFEYNGYYHALIPISLAAEIKNAGELNYVFTFKYGESSTDIPVHLTKRNTGRDSQDIPLEKINSLRNETTIAQMNNTFAPYLKANESKIYWMTDNILTAPTTRRVRSGFGIDIILSNANNYTYQHEGVNYYVKEGDAVAACLPGRVVYVGDTALSGKTVIVEHGGGLKSVYAHLSSVSAVVGQEIVKGTIIGIVGDTGFTTGTTLHFGLYVQDIPVRYYKYEGTGVCLPDEILKLMS